ncbi:hypothetical protein RAMDARK_1510 [Rickettsia amblyommatis str. Darkwater]|uniref:Uncharacterized protein n=1 Tax=Rickettsia amblyommatis (strain GAT-30V) TaxID=1105111 RepID=H8K2W4_RICAG|nr:hypothetical protein [Rickettsia amblyommatis]AFC70232.1 hypothetical protein MCE_07240 [Rickettsia amblyommatis str. GAT-30V]KJV88957.1 hypothetical protein RAMDARK_1510 [Rickettsia amblyommatis str. Darkwater]
MLKRDLIKLKNKSSEEIDRIKTDIKNIKAEIKKIEASVDEIKQLNDDISLAIVSLKDKYFNIIRILKKIYFGKIGKKILKI